MSEPISVDLDDTTGQPVGVTRQRDDSGRQKSYGPGGWEPLCGGGESEFVADSERMALVARHEARHVAVAREYGWT